MTGRALIEEGRLALMASDIYEAEVDAWLLFQYVTGMSRSDFLLDGMKPVAEASIKRYRDCIEKRCTHYPLQYITNSQNFMGFDFYVDEHVLIPRQDTEVLVEKALAAVKPGDRILDMCTGSGCILIALGLLGKVSEGIGVDLSEGALAVARQNGKALGFDQGHFIQSNLFDNIDQVTYAGYFDMIVSNPPYIATAEVLELMPEVRDHEPMMALDGDEDGLKFYRAIIMQAGHYLKTGGKLIFEIGYDQGQAVSELMEAAGYKDVQVIKDLAGLDRVVSGIYM